jgi:ketosteroid isomerase-like protein
MKSLLCMNLISAAALVYPAVPGFGEDRVEREIRRMRQEFVLAINARDFERARVCFSEDAQVFVHNREVLAGEKALESARRLLGSDRLVQFSAETTRVEHSGNLAYEVGRYLFVFRQPDGSTVEDRGRYLDVWKKQGRSDWRILMHAPSSDPPAAGTSAR